MDRDHHVTSFCLQKKIKKFPFRRGDACVCSLLSLLLTTTMFAVARSLRSAVSRSGSYAVCPFVCAPDVSYLPSPGPAPFPNCEEHELKDFGYAYVSFFLHIIFTTT